MTIDNDSPIFVENMNIFCLEGRLQLPPHIENVGDQTDETQTKPQIEVEELDEEAHAWETVNFIKKSLKELQDKKKAE